MPDSEEGRKQNGRNVTAFSLLRVAYYVQSAL